MDIFVFGSNTQGRHGKGSALYARQKFGAIYGQAEGRQGSAYAICTKDLRKANARRSVELSYIENQINTLHQYMLNHPGDRFLIPAIGTSLAGYTLDEIAPMFREIVKLPNATFVGWSPHKFIK